MKVGVWLHDHFYRKHCGRPMVGMGKVEGKVEGMSHFNTVPHAALWHPETMKMVSLFSRQRRRILLVRGSGAAIFD